MSAPEPASPELGFAEGIALVRLQAVAPIAASSTVTTTRRVTRVVPFERGAIGSSADKLHGPMRTGDLGASIRLRLRLVQGLVQAPITTDLRPLVEEVMARTRRSVQRLDPSADLPPWLSASLVELMVRRCSYAGGGGAGALTIESIYRLLANPRRLSKYLRATPRLARHFAKELSLLDAFPARKQPRARRKRARADVIDREHATAVERSAAPAACSTRSSLATIGSRTNVVVENGFVGLRSGFNTPEGFSQHSCHCNDPLAQPARPADSRFAYSRRIVSR